MSLQPNQLPNANGDHLMDHYINLAKTGHMPLFFEDWLRAPLENEIPVSLAKANRTVRSFFKKCEKHRTLERKKTLLIALPDQERQEFIRSFLKVVERDIIKDLRNLH